MSTPLFRFIDINTKMYFLISPSRCASLAFTLSIAVHIMFVYTVTLNVLGAP